MWPLSKQAIALSLIISSSSHVGVSAQTKYSCLSPNDVTYAQICHEGGSERLEEGCTSGCDSCWMANCALSAPVTLTKMQKTSSIRFTCYKPGISSVNDICESGVEECPDDCETACLSQQCNTFVVESDSNYDVQYLRNGRR